MFRNSEGEIRSGWKIGIVYAVFLALLMLVSFVLSFGFVSIMVSSNELTLVDGVITNLSENALFWNEVLSYLLMLMQEVIMIVVSLAVWKRLERKPIFEMGLKPLNEHGKEMIAGLFLGAASITVVFILLVVTGNASVSSTSLNLNWGQLSGVLLFVLVGFAEEIFGRGYMMSVLRQTRSLPVIYIVSAILFSLMHGANPSIGFLPLANIFLVGLLFCHMYVRSGNIWMPIGFHITWNYFQGYVWGFPVSGLNTSGLINTQMETATLFNGGSFGPEGGLFVTGIIVVLFFVVNYYYRNTHFDFIRNRKD